MRRLPAPGIGKSLDIKGLGNKKRLHLSMQPSRINPRLCRFAGIPNLTVQGGHSQFNFGFIGLATLTPVKQYSATYAHKWFKEYMAWRTRQEALSLLQTGRMSKPD